MFHQRKCIKICTYFRISFYVVPHKKYSTSIKTFGDFFFIKAFRRIFHQANTFYHWRVTNFFSMTMSKCWQACQSTKTNRKYNNPAFCIVHVELVVVHKHLWPSHTPHCFKKEKYYNNKKFVQYVLLQQLMIKINVFLKKERKQINTSWTFYSNFRALCRPTLLQLMTLTFFAPFLNVNLQTL